MAIIPDLPGIEVVICVNKIPLEEYEDVELEQTQDADESGGFTKVVTKFIESVEGQEFSFRYTVTKHYKEDCETLLFLPTIDSTPYWGAGRFTNKGEFGSGKDWTQEAKGIEARSERTLQGIFLPFKFSAIETSLSDDVSATLESDAKRMGNIGQLIIEVSRRKNGRYSAKPKKYQSDTTIYQGAITTVHEKALKGQPKYHSAGFGDAKPSILSKRSFVSDPLDEGPIAKFIFKYRSKEALKQLLILERTPEPEESPQPFAASPSALDALDAEQKRKVEIYAQSLLRGSSSGPSSTPKIKRERDDNDGSGISSKKARRSGKQITIDLTDD